MTRATNLTDAERIKISFVSGGEAGSLGYPISDQTTPKDGQGEFCHFSWGSIYRNPADGVFEIEGQIRKKWNELHGEVTSHLYLKASNGQYLSVAPGEENVISVQFRELPGPYETFTINRPDDGIQVLYTFQEGSGRIIHDISGVGEPLDLILHSTEVAEWLPEGGLAITAPNFVDAIGPATRLIEACQTTNELTIEAWIRPTMISEIAERSPERIITLSIDPKERNFTLGQRTGGDPLQARYEMRLRTTETSSNGQPFTQSDSDTVTDALIYTLYP